MRGGRRCSTSDSFPLPRIFPRRSRLNVVTWRLARPSSIEIYGEFEEMPGLLLTLGQAARLFGLRPDIVARILARLTFAGVLCRRRDGQFASRIGEV